MMSVSPVVRAGLVCGLGVLLAGPAALSTKLCLLATSLAWLALGGHHTLYLAYHTLPRDLVIAKRFVHLLSVNLAAKWRDNTVGELFLRTADRLPDKVMLILCGEEEGGRDEQMTYRQCREKSCQIARYFLKQGFEKGDVVGLVMENRLDYCCYWLGLSYIGVIPALVNHNLRQQALLHTLTVAKCRAVIFSQLQSPGLAEVADKVSVPLYCADDSPLGDAVSLPDLLAVEDTAPLTHKLAGYNDPIFYIYTSGTTGLPKAAVIKHSRYLFASYCLHCMGLTRPADIFYSVLPMYHSAAHVCLGVTLTEGNTAVSRRKLSAGRFWSDCCRHGVTCAQYIGEIARYLYATPPCPAEAQHSIRMMFGNGLRPQIWSQFVSRFRINQINEFYGSTEGNCSVGNFSNKVGAVGFVSVLFPFLLPLGIIRVDRDTDEPERDPDTGLAVACQHGEAGELVGRIDRGHPVRDYHGYADQSSTSKKMMQDVFRKGDLYFRSGDILVMDEFGWLYFKDRAGDTFRWKGENVSTMEVEATISQLCGLRDCVVYGVEIPGTEGRAGMAAIPDPECRVDLAALYTGLASRLPSYARPLFIRRVERIDVTATFKLKKRELQLEGFVVDGEAVFVLDATAKTYSPLTSEVHHNIVNGNMRF